MITTCQSYKLYIIISGTFGQPEQWDLYNTATFFHPMVPYDVLIDPMSLPSHPVLKEGSKTEDDMFEEIKKKEDESVSQLSNFYNGKIHETKHPFFYCTFVGLCFMVINLFSVLSSHMSL